MQKSKYSPQLINRAKNFHELWKQGFTVQEAAKSIGIAPGTIYAELQSYAVINEVPYRDAPNRLYYIKDYKPRAKYPKPDVKNQKTESNVKTEKNESIEITEKSKIFDKEAFNEYFDDIINKAEYLIGAISNSIDEHMKIISEFKEEENL